MGAVRLSNRQLTLEEARANFKSAVDAADPAVIACELIKTSPLKAVVAAMAVGALVGISGVKVSRAFFPGVRIVAKALKRLV